MRVVVDGREVEVEGRLLDACRAAGADVPAWCDAPGLTVRGHCRGCVVEADGRDVAACSTPARDGAVVVTDSPRLRAYRRDLAELMLSESRPAGAVGPELARLGATGERYGPPRERPKDTTHPYLRLDLDRCILCRRCERACAEVQVRFVYAAAGRGAATELTWGPGPFAASDCTSCGACVEACPTEAITDVDRVAVPTPEASVRTTCGYCGVGCQLEVHTLAGRVARVDGAPGAVNARHLCVKGRYAHGFVDHADRLRQPLVREGGRLVPASWEAAIARVAEGLAAHRGRIGGASSSRATNEENYLFQKWMRAGLGTNDVDSCARGCHAPSAAGMRRVLGTGAATNGFADIDLADVLLVVGANVTEAHPVVGARIERAVLRGARLVVVDPRRTELARIADVHLQLRPGTNVPLLGAMAATIVQEGLADVGFLRARTDGWDPFRAWTAGTLPERVEADTGVPAALVREAARLYAGARRPMMLHGLGVTEHFQGSESVALLCQLALLAGAIGRPGVGVNPLRGQNNVQGSSDMGCLPDHLPGYQPVSDPAVRARVGALWGRPVPEAPGRTLPRMLDAARAGALTAMVVFGEDLAQTDPNGVQVRAALERLGFLVVIELFRSPTAEFADVVLPGASWLEKDGTFTNAERRVQRVRAAVPPVAGRTDADVLLALMAATGLPQPFRHPGEVLDEIARVAPAFAGLAFDRLDGDGLQWPVPSAGHPGTAVLHVDGFPHGRARLEPVPWVPSPGLGDGLRLVTGRVLEHHNAGTMTRRTPDRAIVDRDRLEISPVDAAAHGIGDGDPVVVESAHGVARATARVTDRVAPGTLFLSFHFPDTRTNDVTGPVRDRVTDCPEYKLTMVHVRRA